MEDKEVNIEIKEDSKQIYVTGATGGFTPYDFKIVLVNDIVTNEGHNEYTLIKKESSYQLVMSPFVAKQFSNFLDNMIKSFEEDNGKIIEENEN